MAQATKFLFITQILVEGNQKNLTRQLLKFQHLGQEKAESTDKQRTHQFSISRIC